MMPGSCLILVQDVDEATSGLLSGLILASHWIGIGYRLWMFHGKGCVQQHQEDSCANFGTDLPKNWRTLWTPRFQQSKIRILKCLICNNSKAYFSVFNWLIKWM